MVSPATKYLTDEDPLRPDQGHLAPGRAGIPFTIIRFRANWIIMTVDGILGINLYIL